MTTPAPANPVVAALVADLFDDAGIFPPASLPLDAAFDAHRTARMGGFRWMLARFVVPATRVAELADVAPRYGDALRLALIVDDGVDLDATAKTIDEHGWRVESVETLLLDGDVASRATKARTAADGLGASRAFVEVPWNDFPLDQLEATTKALRSHDVGLKVRCAGPTAAHYPETSLLASILRSCADVGIAVKATAGLHHPFRHPDPDTGALSHGFLNLLVAAVLAHGGRASEPDLASALAEEDGRQFSVAGDRLTWRDIQLHASEIAAARRELFTSIGTCSFREPVDDLVALGLLPVP